MRKLTKAYHNVKDKRNLRTIINDIIEKSGSHGRYIQLAKESDKVFMDLYEKSIKLEPKESKHKEDINITLSIPRPERREQLEDKQLDVNDVDYTVSD